MALATLLVSLAIALVVPAMTFRYALQQDRARWLRDQRAAVYVDLLTEASADLEWLEYQMLPPDVQLPSDDRMSSIERRRLGARLQAYGSEHVIRLHNALSGLGGRALIFGRDDGEILMQRVRLAEAQEALGKQVRAEMAGLDERPPKPRRRTLASDAKPGSDTRR